MREDPDFPIFHLRPDKNWINDPNGMMYYQGRYHVFMQYNPTGPLWGDIHWLHFSSSNLIDWKNHGIALSPDTEYDKKGCWSGCAFIDDQGLPALVYSADDGVTRRPALVRGDENAEVWVKYDHNPIISELPMTDLHGFRDHKVFKRNGKWVQLIGSGIAENGIIFCYTS